jgi:rod shape-determining protein MreC
MFRRTGRGRLLLVAFLALSIVIITLDFQRNRVGPLERAKDISGELFAPIQRGVTVVVRPVRNFLSSLGDLSDLRAENQELKQKLAGLDARVDRADAIAEENEILKANAELDEPWFKMETVTAEVISEQAQNYKFSVVIGKGKSDGIESGMGVIDGAAAGLVGKIVDVTEHTATVLLLIDPLGRANARLKDQPETGNIHGNGEGEDLSMVFVRPEAKIEKGAQVVTSAYNEGIFPPSIPIGTVSRVGGTETDLEPEVDVEPTVDFNDLQFLQVLLDTGPRLAERQGAR